MRRPLILQAIVWFILVAIMITAVRFGPAALARLRGGGDCLDQFSLSGDTVLSEEFPPNEEHIWVLSDGKLYYVTGSDAIEVCATGDPANPTFVPR